MMTDMKENAAKAAGLMPEITRYKIDRQPRYCVVFRIPKQKIDACHIFMPNIETLQYHNKKYKTNRLDLSESYYELPNTKQSIINAIFDDKLQIINVYPPTKHRKSWYISVQKYDEEGQKNDLEKVYLNKGDSFKFGYDTGPRMVEV